VYAAAEHRLEINKYWLVRVRHANVGLHKFNVRSALGDITEIKTDIALAVNQPSNVGSGDIADLLHIDSSQP
jgi:hypothetical protein